MVIQELKPSKRVEGRWLAVLEDGSILRLGEGEVIDFALYAGKELTQEEAQSLMDCARRRGLKEKALELLSRKPQSRREVERKLKEWVLSLGPVCWAQAQGLSPPLSPPVCHPSPAHYTHCHQETTVVPCVHTDSKPPTHEPSKCSLSKEHMCIRMSDHISYFVLSGVHCHRVHPLQVVVICALYCPVLYRLQ